QRNAASADGGLGMDFRSDDRMAAAEAASPPPVIEQIGGRHIAPIVIMVAAAGNPPRHAVGGQGAGDGALRHGHEPREDLVARDDVAGGGAIGRDPALEHEVAAKTPLSLASTWMV